MPVDFDDPQVKALLQEHLAAMRGNSPPGTSYALDLSALQVPDIDFWAAWSDGALLGFGALKELTPTTGEIKSMRTHLDHLRRGVAARVLEHLLGVARSRGYVRVSLETGSGPAFQAAHALYGKYGFLPGPAFGDYREGPFNQFLHLDL